MFLGFSSQSVPLSLQLLQAPDRGPGRRLQQSLRGCRSKSKVSGCSLCSAENLKLVFVDGALEFPKNPPCSPHNDTKQLKKERFLLWMQEFSSLCVPGSPMGVEMGLLWSGPKARLSHGSPQPQYLSPQKWIFQKSS